MEKGGEDTDTDIAETVREVLADQPVRLGVLFGSQARGTAGAHSDVDVAVEFESSVTDRFQAQLEVGVAITRALGTDAVDIVDLAAVRPEVGLSALEDGRILVGDADRATELTRQFDQAADRPTRTERRERFDAVLGRLEELV